MSETIDPARPADPAPLPDAAVPEAKGTAPKRKRVVIVGAGFGGISAARVLEKSDLEVIVVDRTNHHLFQPLLYQVATAMLAPTDIAQPIRSVLDCTHHANLSVLLDSVEAVDKTSKAVVLGSGMRLAYDYLVLAPGSRYNYFGNDAEWAPHAPGLKTMDDAIMLRRRILMAFERAELSRDPEERRRLLTFVVIGGGPTGVEMAGAMAELAKATLARDFRHIDPKSTRIVLVEAVDELLGQFTDRQSAYTKETLEKMGVEVMLNAPVKGVESHRVMAGETAIEAETIIWCAGVSASPLVGQIGAETAKGGQVKVSRDFSVPGSPEIFVIGDAAAYEEDGRPLPALAPVAKQQGKHVGRLIAAREGQGRDPGQFHYRDWGTMATIGRAAAVGKFGKVTVKGFPAWLLWGGVHVAYLVGFRNRIMVIVNWLWAWLTYAKGARLITGADREAPERLPTKG
ncbi:NAD(P)/FAD-dependent oxidoreductase [Arsenicitalea aurantiaca]|uniref:NADH:ubiquinone reductase (non-electrogenic) n=1 Tax=Arsenicitalea aurantiaca TaxID=1783274 RepID=A0A433XL18_9HYPH|nr:NAD(P)/FAD-dependent oxidoreductase [Arsenicitalea aurantiaca]RUT34751.1 NAD(P)/FAD-dependent oxidoreductase [Arsenicitalea aurantiaca]